MHTTSVIDLDSSKKINKSRKEWMPFFVSPCCCSSVPTDLSTMRANRRRKASILVAGNLFSCCVSSAFVVRHQAYARSAQVRPTKLSALTERQQQFWEDVENGLDDLENYYESKGQSLDRIRGFGRSSRGETPTPAGYAPKHQPSEEHVEGLEAKPFWDVVDDADRFPWAADIEANAGIIRDEFMAKLEKDADNANTLFAGDSAWQSKIMGKGWSAFRLRRLGEWNSDNCREFPKTTELLQNLGIPFAVRGVCFARQAPGSGVEPHSDGRNFILTSHLGLNIPAEGCWITSGEEKRSWDEGKLLTLDTSFEHSTGNESAESRDVLIIDFWHPDLSEGERRALEFVYDTRNKFERGEVPFRKPTGRIGDSKEETQDIGIAGLWNALTGRN